jgi:hypothetical protein
MTLHSLYQSPERDTRISARPPTFIISFYISTDTKRYAQKEHLTFLSFINEVDFPKSSTTMTTFQN